MRTIQPMKTEFDKELATPKKSQTEVKQEVKNSTYTAFIISIIINKRKASAPD